MTVHKKIHSANMAVGGGAKFFLAFGASSRCILRPCVGKGRKNPKSVKCDGWTDQPTDGPTKRGEEARSVRLKSLRQTNRPTGRTACVRDKIVPLHSYRGKKKE